MAELGFTLSPSDSKTWLLSILCCFGLPNTFSLDDYVLTKWGLSFPLAFSCCHVIFPAARCVDGGQYF